jgi:hypothetical protein
LFFINFKIAVTRVEQAFCRFAGNCQNYAQGRRYAETLYCRVFQGIVAEMLASLGFSGKWVIEQAAFLNLFYYPQLLYNFKNRVERYCCVSPLFQRFFPYPRCMQLYKLIVMR